MNRRTLFTALGLAAVGIGIFLLYRVFQKNDFGEVVAVLSSVKASDIGLALLFTAISYGCVAVLEFFAVLYVRKPVPIRRVVMTALAAIGIGRTIGLAALSSGAVRYRMYSRAGLSLVNVGTIILFSGLSVAAGFAAIGGTALLWRGDFLAPLLGVSPTMVRGIGAGALVYLAVYIALCAILRRPLKFRSHRLRLPSLRLALGQVVVSSLNLLCIVGVLYIALRNFTDQDYPVVAMLYLGGDLSAVIGHVPGGWGVLEYIVTTALTDGKVLSGVVLFRAIYYFVPLGAGLLIFLADEVQHRVTSQPERSLSRLQGKHMISDAKAR
ncbi:YbhN family protein [uncultured Ferrovibrio sp.]|jgi:uncharacterized membrane protein YbhN (UPF0104 family)|uniref:lysylphosphatidylglycerol synthase transmembrane domain-containing protein n=1 Tax=uncultured Ferrovibrio sp. TaxID=1576913 RepID=UPI00261653CD|nr:YbhN family protein [uncultured Ferrovibrio sp.]